MKAKIIYIGLLLTGFLAACNTTNSKKKEVFDSSLNIVWATYGVVSIPNDDDSSEICHQYREESSLTVFERTFWE